MTDASPEKKTTPTPLANNAETNKNIQFCDLSSNSEYMCAYGHIYMLGFFLSVLVSMLRFTVTHTSDL